MNDNDSLYLALEDWFDKPLSDLPDALRQRVEEVFVVRWDSLTIDHRRKRAADYDCTHDPATEPKHQIWFDFLCEKDDLEKELARVSALPAPLPSEEEAKNRLLAPLKQKLALMEQIYASNDTQRVEDYLKQADAKPEQQATANVSTDTKDGTKNNEKELTSWLRETWIRENRLGGTAFFNALKKYENQPGSPIVRHNRAGKDAGFEWRTSAGTMGYCKKKTILTKTSMFKRGLQQSIVNNKK